MEEKTQWGKDPDHGFIWNTIDHLLYWREHREKPHKHTKQYCCSCFMKVTLCHAHHAPPYCQAAAEPLLLHREKTIPPNGQDCANYPLVLIVLPVAADAVC